MSRDCVPMPSFAPSSAPSEPSQGADATALDRTHFVLDPEPFDRLAALLDAPAAPNPAQERLLASKAPWGS